VKSSLQATTDSNSDDRGTGATEPRANPCIEVRPLQRQDIPAIADTVIACFHDNTRWWSCPWNALLKMGVREDLQAQLRSHRTDRACLVAVAKNIATGTESIAGTVEISLRRDWVRSPSISTYLSNLAVRADYRRQGVGRRLLIASERVARDWSTGCLSLHVMENNPAARKLYEANGYRMQRAEMDWSNLWGSPRRLFLSKYL